MDRKQRVLIEIDGALVDASNVVNRYTQGGSITIPLASEAAIYIGSELPFNHRYIEVATANDVEAELSAAIWNASAWESVDDLVDETSDDGATLAQGGKVSFHPNIDRPGWSCEYKSKDIADLADGPQMLNLFWCRLTFSEALNEETAIRYIGQKFCEEQDLFDLYPDLNRANLMAAFASGKTDWNEQIFVACENIVDDLRQRKVIVRREQIMDTSILREAAVHKTAEIIYRGLGNGHLDNRILAAKDFKAAMGKDFFEVDRNGSGMASFTEKNFTSSFGRR